MKLTLLTIVILLAQPLLATGQATVYNCYSEYGKFEITGFVSKKNGYHVINLDQTLCLLTQPMDGAIPNQGNYTLAKVVQISSTDAKAFENQKVLVNGYAYQSHTAHHIENLVFSAESIQPFSN